MGKDNSWQGQRQRAVRLRGKNVVRSRPDVHQVGERQTHDEPTTGQERMETRQVGRGGEILRNTAKVLPGEVGKPEGGKHRKKETANMLHVQDQLPIRRSHEEPREERPQGTQAGGTEGDEEQEIRRSYGDIIPYVQEELHKSEDDEATDEDGARGDPGLENMQRM